jgi:hypothetical protein
MTISKVHWDMEGENVRLSIPFSKVDAERRIVSGFATLDNVDKQADIVTTEASIKAFKKFRGNIREMHQPLSVGKMVGFKEDKYFDPDTKKFYTGIYVSAYISKGAQNTWEKVLDGTLSGFSIGGRMNKYDDMYDDNMDKTVRVIKDYDLMELSLVDNPANQFANVVSIEKVDGVDVLKGDLVDVSLENVFWDAESGVVLVSESESEVSPVNGSQMQNIGFVEKNDDEKTKMIKFLVDSAKGINLSKMTKEASPMTDTTNDVVEETTVETSEVAPEADATIEDAAEVSEVVAETVVDEAEVAVDAAEEEVATEGTDVVELEEATAEVVSEEVSKSQDVVAAIAEVRDGITTAFSDLNEVVKSLSDEVASLKKSLNLANAKLADAERDFDEFGKRIDAVEADTAFRKSGDLGEIVQDRPEMVEKSLWGGRFLKTADLFR